MPVRVIGGVFHQALDQQPAAVSAFSTSVDSAEDVVGIGRGRAPCLGCLTNGLRREKIIRRIRNGLTKPDIFDAHFGQCASAVKPRLHAPGKSSFMMAGLRLRPEPRYLEISSGFAASANVEITICFSCTSLGMSSISFRTKGSPPVILQI